MSNKHKKIVRQFSRYFAAAGIGYIVDFTTLYIFHEILHVHYLLAAAVGFTFGIIVLYVLSRLFVFGEPKVKSKTAEIGLFVLIGVGGLIILTILMWLLTGLAGINYLLAKILATVIVYGWNFFARRALYKD